MTNKEICEKIIANKGDCDDVIYSCSDCPLNDDDNFCNDDDDSYKRAKNWLKDNSCTLSDIIDMIPDTPENNEIIKVLRTYEVKYNIEKMIKDAIDYPLNIIDNDKFYCIDVMAKLDKYTKVIDYLKSLLDKK